MTLNDVDAYHFELRFRIPEGTRLWSAETEIALGTDRLRLSASGGGELREATCLSLFGFGYATAEQARGVSEYVRRALTFAVIENNIAIDWPENSPRRSEGLSV